MELNLMRTGWKITHQYAVSLGLTALCFVVNNASAAPAASAAPDVTGNWQGTLDVAQTKLRLLFKIQKTRQGPFVASMDSLDQGVHDLPVDKVAVNDKTVQLEINLLKGMYVGTMVASGTTLSGTWTQDGKATPLILKRVTGNAVSSTETLSPADLAASKAAAQKFAGEWTGALSSGSASVSFVMKLGKTAEGAATGTLDSPQQKLSGIPLSAITYKDGKFRFEARGLGSTYDAVSFNGSTMLTGQWHQAGQTIPLKFMKNQAGQAGAAK
ncbi:MAG TPA: hypothetical protein VLT36_09760 [Candidatus Dormibacteraeota bacterium]|nr:hypothetical protein [Candidatus Dormibacteraeota bacterium]